MDLDIRKRHMKYSIVQLNVDKRRMKGKKVREEYMSL